MITRFEANAVFMGERSFGIAEKGERNVISGV